MIDLKKDKRIEPTDENLKVVLGNSFLVYKTLIERLPDFEVDLAWRFYKDGGWLAKAARKKKTIFWGKAEDGRFEIAFHFNERSKQGVLELDISHDVKEIFSNAPLNGRSLTTLKIDLCSESQLSDVYQLIEYKKSAK